MTDYREIARQMKAQQLQMSVSASIRRDPDTEAKLRSLADEVGLPVEAVRANQQEVEYQRRLKSFDYRNALKDSPTTAGWLSNPNNASIGHDDHVELADIERWYTGIKRSVQMGATVNLGASLLDAWAFGIDKRKNLLPLRLASSALGAANPLDEYLDAGAEGLRERAGRAREAARRVIPTPESETEAAVQSGMQSFGQNMALLPLGLGSTTAVGGGRAVAYAFGLLTGAQEYGDARRAGFSEDRATVHGILQGAIETGTEMLPAQQLFKMISARTGLGSMLVKQMAAEGATEQVATFLQDLESWLVLHPEGTTKQFLADRPSAAYQTLIATMVGTGAQVATVQGGMKIADRLSGNRRAVEHADSLKDGLRKAGKSKVRTRSPQAFQSLVESMEGAESVFIDANVLHQSAREMAPEELEAILPGVTQKLSEAIGPDALIELPMSQVLTNVPGTALEETIIQNAREHEGAPSLAEQQQGEEEMAERFAEDAKNILSEAEDSATLQESADRVYQQIKQDVIDTGHYAPDAADAIAQLARDFIIIQSQRANQTPEEFFQANRLSWTGAFGGSSQMLAQGRAVTNTPEFRAWFGESKVVDENGEPLVVYHGTGENAPEVFDKGTIKRGMFGHGFHFAESSLIGSFYAGQHSGGGSVMPVYLSISNPYELRDLTKWYDLPGATDKERTEHLIRQGYDGMKVWHGPHYSDESSSGWGWVAFSPEQIKSATGNNGNFDPNDPSILNQSDKAPLAGFDPQKLLIALTERSNLSSPLHELGHYFLEILDRMAEQGNAEASKDIDTFLGMVGVRKEQWLAWRQQYQANPREIPDGMRKAHEAFAEGVEGYLFTGKAPTIEQQGLFRRFSAWMKQAYKSLKDFLGKDNLALNPDFRRLMDRLLATEEAIKAAEDAAGMMPDDEAHNVAVEQLQAKSLKDMRWTIRARDKALKRLQAEAEEKRKDVEHEVSVEVKDTPVERARAWLKENRHTTPEYRDSLQRWQERREAVVEREREARTQTLLDTQGKGLKPIQKAGLVNQNRKIIANEAERAALEWEKENPRPQPDVPEANWDMMAEQFGFDSGDALQIALRETPPAHALIEQLTNQRMLERHGDINSPEALAEAADAAVHNEARARALATELKAQQDALGARQDTGKTASGTGRRVTVNALVAASKAFAQRLVATKKAFEMKKAIRMHRTAEAKAAARWLKATKAGDTSGAIQAKRDQALNNAVVQALAEAQQQVEKMARFLRRYDSAGVRKSIDPEYLVQIDQLLERVDLRKSTTQAQAVQRESLKAWIEEQQSLGFEPEIPKSLLADTKLTSYKDMTLDELQGLTDAVTSIEHLGKLKHRLLTSKKKRELNQAAAELASAVVSTGQKQERSLEPQKGIKRWAKEFLASHRKLFSYFREFDGSDKGPWWDLLGRGMNERSTDEAVRSEKFTEAFATLLEPIAKLPGGMTGGRRLVRSLGGSLSRQGRLAVMLNAGNAQNLQRMNDGNGISQQAIEEIASQMTPAELRFVNEVWELIDSFWPEVSAKQERVTGVAPEKVQAEAFEATANDGTVVQMRGGYYPLKYDADQSDKAAEHEAMLTGAEIMRGARVRSTTRRGHTEERAQTVKRPVRLDMSTVTQHAAEVIHDLVWHEWLIDANRLISHPDVTKAIRDYYGPEVLKEVKQSIPAIAVGELANNDATSRALLQMRKNISRSVMGISATTAMLQPFGITQSMARIGVKPVLKGLGRMIGDAAKLESAMTFISSKSKMMQSRARLFNREIYEISSKLAGKSKFAEVVDVGLFYTMRKMQLLADMPTWLGQYEKVLAETNDEDEAIAQADRAVRESQGSGENTALSSVQRKHPFLTMFYSYFNATWNLLAESTAKTNFKNPKAVAGWMADVAMLTIVPALGPAIALSLLRGGDDEPEEMAKKLLQAQASYLLSLLIVVRELSGVATGFDYTGPAIGRLGVDVSAAAQQTAQGELDEAAVLSYIRLLGTGLGLPTTQLTRMYRGWKAWDEGEAGPGALLFGPPPKD